MTQQRYKHSITTIQMLNMAHGDPDGYYEVQKDEEIVSVSYSSRTGVVYWHNNNRVVSEKEVQDVLARWSIEGVI